MKNTFNKSFRLMGTIIDVEIEHPSGLHLLDEVESKLVYYRDLFSANDDHSQLMRINNNAGVEITSVSSELFELIKVGLKHSLDSNSYMNITIGPLTSLWRIGFDDAKIPTDLEISDALNLINPKDVIIDEINHNIYLKYKGMRLDLGCIAKGYIADKIIEYLISEKVKSALINLGGNVLVYGDNPLRDDKLWRIGIVDPYDKNKYKKILKIHNESVVTSGINERNFKGYHHIFDSNTGYPIESDVASLTIISKHSIDCEIWTTKLFGYSSNEIVNIVNEIDYIECVVIRKDGTIVSSMKG